MPTIQDILADVSHLQEISDDLHAKQQVSHDAVQAVADTTSSQNALVAQAQANAAVAIDTAQTEADDAVQATNEAKTALDDQIEKIKGELEAFKTA